MLIETLRTIFVMSLTTVIPVVLYAIRHVGLADFNVRLWFAANRTRFALGGILVILLSLLIIFVPEAKEILTLLGFNAEKSVAALGFATGSMLIVGLNANNANTQNSQPKE